MFALPWRKAGSTWTQGQRGADGGRSWQWGEVGLQFLWWPQQPVKGQKSCLGCPCRGCCEQSFFFQPQHCTGCYSCRISKWFLRMELFLPWKYLQQIPSLATTYTVPIFMALVWVLTFLKECSFVFPTRRLNWLDWAWNMQKFLW